MKRLISLLLFLTLCCAVQASARMNAYIAGSVASAVACTTSNDSETQVAWATDNNLNINQDYVAQPFTVTANTYITQYNVYLRDTTATGNTTTCGVYTNNSGVPGTIVTGTEKTSDFSTNAWTEVSFVLDAAVLLTGTTYYVKCHAASAGMIWGRASGATGSNACSDADDSSWSCALDYTMSLKWYGCAP